LVSIENNGGVGGNLTREEKNNGEEREKEGGEDYRSKPG